MEAENQPLHNEATPVEIRLKREAQNLTVVWGDRRESVFDLLQLRKNCPCAACTTQRQRREESTELLPVLQKDPGQGPPQAVGAQLVGNYGIQLVWSDGHDTGIFDFRHLRALDAGE